MYASLENAFVICSAAFDTSVCFFSTTMATMVEQKKKEKNLFARKTFHALPEASYEWALLTVGYNCSSFLLLFPVLVSTKFKVFHRIGII